VSQCGKQEQYRKRLVFGGLCYFEYIKSGVGGINFIDPIWGELVQQKSLLATLAWQQVKIFHSIKLDLYFYLLPNTLCYTFFIVELEGFEPSSKQGTDKLSSCLVCYWFSRNVRKQTP